MSADIRTINPKIPFEYLSRAFPITITTSKFLACNDVLKCHSMGKRPFPPTTAFLFLIVILTVVFGDDIDASENPGRTFVEGTGVLRVEPIVSGPLMEDIPLDLLISDLSKRRHVPERGFSNETKLKILELHNLYRGNVTPPAGNMAFMEWDDQLEHLAQLWADGCVFAHGKPSNTSYPGPYGQNLYIGTDPTGDLGLWLWYDEYRFYNVKSQFCDPNEQCGHYVQMAWGESRRLGCGIKKCGLRYLIVCHYYPAAMKGLQMYIIAKPCSQCTNESGSLCQKNLCMAWDQCERNTKLCGVASCNLKCQNCGNLNKKTCQCDCADGWDSPDCSRPCSDEHERCGVNPGFPNKASCSMNRNAVARKFCRKMCETCNPYTQDLKSNYICCGGIVCENGYVLDMDRKPCRCTLLCPGPHCDFLDGKGTVPQCIALHVLLFYCAIYFILLRNLKS